MTISDNERVNNYMAKKILLELTKDEADLLLPQIKAGYDMDKDMPDEAPPGAAKNWKSMLKKLKAAVK